MDTIFNSLFDNRNEWVWHRLNSRYNCHLISSRLHHIVYYFDDNKLFISVPNDCKIERLTHELIRIYLQSKGITITNCLVQLFYEEPLLDWTFTENTFMNIGHTLEDFKILPLFLESGFTREQFFTSYGIEAISEFHKNRIILGFNRSTPSRHSVELYVFKFFTIKWGTIYSDECLDFYKQLRLLNTDLYEILDTFYKEWMGFDVDRFEQHVYSYDFFSKKFVHDLGIWTIKLLHSSFTDCIRQNATN